MMVPGPQPRLRMRAGACSAPASSPVVAGVVRSTHYDHAAPAATAPVAAAAAAALNICDGGRTGAGRLTAEKLHRHWGCAAQPWGVASFGLVSCDGSVRLSLARRRPGGELVCHAAPAVPAGVLERSREEDEEQEELVPLPVATESIVDDPQLHNPLQRMQRLNTAWFGVITDYEGVVVSDTEDVHIRAWLQVADEKGYPRPLGWQLRRLKGVRNEVVVTNVFHWTHNPSTARCISARKEEIYDELIAGAPPVIVADCRKFLKMLRNYEVPRALACAVPEGRVRPALVRLGLDDLFDVLVTAEDSGAPETEYYYMYAADQLQRPYVRCVVVGDSNRAVEAAHELGMKSIVVTGGKPCWDFSAADLVVRSLSQLSFVNMKNLFANEELVEPRQIFEEESQEPLRPYDL